MTRTEILARIDLLRDVFAFSLETRRTLNVGQRICLTQERVAWLEVLEWETIEVHPPKYIIPEHLEKKVQAIYKTIKETNWVKPDYESIF